MLNPFIDLINTVIYLINLTLIVYIVLSILIHFDIINRYNPLIQRIYYTLGRLVEPMLRPIRRLWTKLFPGLSDIDVSPIILMVLLHFLDDLLYSWFYRI